MIEEMQDTCASFREHLLTRDEQQPLIGAHAEHVAECDACAGLYASLTQVDLELAQLAPIEAPPELVASTLMRLAESADSPTEVAHQADAAQAPVGIFRAIFELVFGGFGKLLATLFWPLKQFPRHPRLGSGLVAVAALCGFLVFGGLFLSREPSAHVSMAPPGESPAAGPEFDRGLLEESQASPQAGSGQLRVEGEDGRFADGAGADSTTTRARSWENGEQWRALTTDGEEITRGEFEQRFDSPDDQVAQVGGGQNDIPFATSTGNGGDARNALLPRAPEPDPEPAAELPAARDEVARDQAVRTPAPPTPPSSAAAAQGLRENTAREAAQEAERQLMNGPGAVTNGGAESTGESGLRYGGAPMENTRSSSLARAQALLRERERVEGLSFQPARGHFSNSYVPGDPALRTLHQRLVAAGTTTLGSTGATGLELAEAARSFRQPLDAPHHAALALSVRGDQRAAEGPQRMLVQVGLRAAARRGGRRPALHVGVVLDLSHPLAADSEARVVALLDALSAARDVGDRISLHVAGAQGGTLIEAGAFRHGQVQVAVDQLFHDAPRGTPAVATSLDGALRSTLASLADAQDPATPLGSSFLLVITPGLTPSPALRRAAHVGAVAGIPTSVVGLGAADPSSLDALALAGQGRRRLLDDASEAEALVRAEFDAISQVVARAIRLRIRLAPGTRLVSVLDSHRLDAAASARVREAERSIDQRLARSLGIQADRDEDADGITIFIPAFYANDSHVILLDVVASGPGPVAEVSARYKDLLRLRNGEARSSLRLTRGRRARGPLERAVLKNFLAHQMSQALAQAADLVRGGRRAEARARLTQFVELSRGVQQLVPAFGSDRELAADLSLALRYDAAIQTSASPQQVIVADSMRLASRRKHFLPMFSR